MDRKPKILILGGGYGGLKCAITLQKKLHSEAEVTLISKHDYHYQTTLLHKVSVGTYSARKARIFFRKILDLRKVGFIKDTIVSIDPANKRVSGESNCYEYDYLVIALGFIPNTFGINGVEKHCFTLSSLNSALKLRNHIEMRFKDFTNDVNDLSFIVCGSGFSGIEFAGELATQIDELTTISAIDKSLVKIICISKGEHILPMFHQKDAMVAKKKLDKLGVRFIQGVVRECKENSVIVESSTGKLDEIFANTIVWTAGVKGSNVVEDSPLQSKNGRILIDSYLRVKEFNNIFVVGDCGIATERDLSHAPTAQLASQMGEYVANSLIVILNDKNIKSAFHFKHRGTVCAIGHTDGVGVVFGISVSGEISAFFKNFIENKWIFSIGGLINVFKKGQFRFRSSS